MDSIYLGTVMTFAFSFTPMYFAACNGALMSISQNQALYSLLGNAFGGSPSSTFGLPNLNGRTATGVGTATGGTVNIPFAASFGAERTILDTANLPAHTHSISEVQANNTVHVNVQSVTVNASDAQAAQNKPTANYWAKGWVASGSTIASCYNNSKNVTMASDAVAVTLNTTFAPSNLAIGTTGAGQAFNQWQPSLALNFAICTNGLYPQRT